MIFNDFEEYKKQEEPEKQEKAENWSIAIGLQAVDGLKPSDYLIEVAKENIEGKIDAKEVRNKIDTYYKTDEGKFVNKDIEEADKVSLHIAEILAEVSFTFMPKTIISIHRKLFFDIFPKLAGIIRDYNITKKETVLNGGTVFYGTATEIRDALDYDFDREKKFDYKGLTQREKIEHIADFISSIWQIHPFGEGNTRTIAVFTIKYLKAMGFHANNEYFEKNAKYFRDALVRANYQNLKNDITYSKTYLYDFFDNLLLDGQNVLDSNNLHIDVGVKTQDVGVNVGVNNAVLNLLIENKNLTAKKIAQTLGKSNRTIERAIAKLKEEKRITRIGSDKTGHWQVIKSEGDDV